MMFRDDHQELWSPRRLCRGYWSLTSPYNPATVRAFTCVGPKRGAKTGSPKSAVKVSCDKDGCMGEWSPYRATHSTRTVFPLLSPEQLVAEVSSHDLQKFQTHRVPILSSGTTIVPFMLHDPSPSSLPPLNAAAELRSLTLFSWGFSQGHRMYQSVVRLMPFSLSTWFRMALVGTEPRFCS